MTDSYEFQTLDEVVIHYSTYYSDFIIDKSLNVYEYILLNELYLVAKVIRSKTNIPSIHDLMLIATINRIPGITYGDMTERWIDPRTEYWIKTTNEILEIYRDRKVQS